GAVICSFFFFFSSRRRHTRCLSDWSSDVCSSDLVLVAGAAILIGGVQATRAFAQVPVMYRTIVTFLTHSLAWFAVLYLVAGAVRSEEHTSELQSLRHLVCRLLLEKKKINN